MDFKNFCDEKIENDKTNNKIHINNKIDEDFIKEQTEQSFEKYSNYSNEQLMEELIKMTNSKKRDGTLDNTKLNQMYNAISNLLPNENKSNLKDIFDRLNND